jgi:hypothetical protein
MEEKVWLVIRVAWLAYQCNLPCGLQLCTLGVKGRSVPNGCCYAVVNRLPDCGQKIGWVKNVIVNNTRNVIHDGVLFQERIIHQFPHNTVELWHLSHIRYYQITHSLPYSFINLFRIIWDTMSELGELIKIVLTEGKPTVISLPKTQSVDTVYHTIHHLTHIAVTRLTSYWTDHLHYLLLNIFSFNSLSVHNSSYLSPTVLVGTFSI